MNDAVKTLLTPAVEALGYELVLVQLLGRGGDQLLRLYIDAPAGIGVEDCERVSRQVAALLDVEDPIPGAYTLEVSSPGLDRPLVTPAHFERHLGQRVRVKAAVPIDGRRNFTGVLVAAGDDEIEIAGDEARWRLPFAQIETARLVPEL
ncbi:MAG: ribosome maturation factor RimP [Pseudomonadota bacterium]|nr:ribosome maturation factor RimP [Pseudomonadota bacterium]